MNTFFAEKLINFPKLTLLAVCLLAGLSVLPMKSLWLTIDYKSYFDPSDPQLQSMNDFERTFFKDNSVIMLIAPKNKNMFTANNLSALTKLTHASWQMPHSTRVNSLSNYQHSYAENDDLIVSPLWGKEVNQAAEKLSKKNITRIKKTVMAEPSLVGNLISKKGDVAAIITYVQIPDNALKEVPEISAWSRHLLQSYSKKYPNIDFKLTGTVLADQSFADAIAQDSAWLTPLSYLLIFSLLVVLLRSIWGMVICLSVIFFSVIIAFGVKALINGSVNPVTILAPSVIMIVAVADSVHLLVGFFQQMLKGHTKRESISESLHINFQPVILTSLTTAIGFLCLNFSESPPFRDMGNTVAVGVIAAMLLSITLLPALVLLLPIEPSQTIKTHNDDSLAQHLMIKLATKVLHSPSKAIIICLAVLIVLVSGLPKNQMNEVFVNYFDDSFAFRRANDFMNTHLNGLHHINYTLDTGKENGIYNPDYLRKVDAFARYMQKQTEVSHVSSFTEVLKRLNKNMHNDQTDALKLPTSREEAAQYTLLYALSLPYGLGLSNQLSFDKSSTHVTLSLYLTGSTTILDVDQRAQKWLTQHAPELLTVGVSIDTMFSHIAANNIPTMMYGTLLALLLISVLILIAMRSWQIGLISLLPNLLPALMTFGLWGYLNGLVGLTESIITSVTLGLIVDDTIHFLSKYQRGIQVLKLSVNDAILYAYRTVGVSLVITSVVFIAGFGVLALSHYQGTSHLGLLTAITILFALAADLIFLPALLSLLGKLKKNEAH